MRKSLLIALTFIGFFLFIFTLQTQSQTIRYVIAGASGTGTSWANASGDLQAMINASAANDAVWVAGGTYKPKYRADNMSGTNVNDRNNAFVLMKDIKIYGGFAGTETLLAQRDLTLTANASILSGDRGVVNNNSDNAYHVVISAGSAGTAELNGFTIQDGNANGSGSITVNSVTISVTFGGGIYNYSSSPILTNMIISGNSANTGGGIYNSSSSPILTNVIISGNSAGSNGGGTYNTSSSSPVLTNVIFSGNKATNAGGGECYNVGCSSVLTNVNIFGNSAKIGGGIYNGSSCSLILTNVTISGNIATTNGGGIYISDSYSNPKIRNSIIYGNTSGIYNSNSILVIEYSLVQGYSDITKGNIDGSTDPLFVNQLAPGLSTSGDYRLQDASPVIGKGNIVYFNTGQNPDLSAITTDPDSNPRKRGTTIDMGAYENQTSVLPITLINFTAKAEGNLAKLEW